MSKIKTAVIPAAGLGTRMLPISYSVPKELLPIIDKPIIQCVVEEALEAGIEKIVIVTSRGKESIVDHFDPDPILIDTLNITGKKRQSDSLRSISLTKNISVVRQNSPLGLGHAVLCAKQVVGDEPFAVMLPDVLATHSTKMLLDVWNNNQPADAVLFLQHVNDPTPYGVAINPQSSGNNVFFVDGFIEKPSKDSAPSNLAIVGRYLFSPNIWDSLENIPPGRNGEIQLTDAINALRGKKLGVQLDINIEDAGDPLGWLMANVNAGLKDPRYSEHFKDFLKRVVE